MTHSSTRASILFLFVASFVNIAVAADHRVEPLKEAAPTDGISPEIAGLLAPEGIRVIRGTSREVCDIWICKEWAVKAFESKGDILYPFTPGQLIGVVRFPRKGSDFRDQDIPEGLYTLRYSLQPVDGAHLGTSPTRDFVVLLPAAEDTAAGAMEYKPLVDLSQKVSGTMHPALLSLQKPEGDDPIRHVEAEDWWVVHLKGKGAHEKDHQDLAVDLVVSGQAKVN